MTLHFYTSRFYVWFIVKNLPKSKTWTSRELWICGLHTFSFKLSDETTWLTHMFNVFNLVCKQCGLVTKSVGNQCYYSVTYHFIRGLGHFICKTITHCISIRFWLSECWKSFCKLTSTFSKASEMKTLDSARGSILQTAGNVESAMIGSNPWASQRRWLK